MKQPTGQHKAFWEKLKEINRLRSPHTVFVYGAVTARSDRLILVMELLSGGDLRTFLKQAERHIPMQVTHRIVGDVCSGMAFLHSKLSVHGDLKSGNILLDGLGRAKVGFVQNVHLATEEAVNANTFLSLALEGSQLCSARVERLS